VDLTIDEIEFPPRRASRFYDRWALGLIRDSRDLPFIDLILICSFLVLPFGLYLVLDKSAPLWLLPFYYALVIFFLGPFILMLHNSCHRTLFKKKYGLLNRYIPWVLGPFFGETPETYYLHHIGMHHPENNLKEDLSSTLPYRRDSFIDYCRYFLRFLILGVVELPRYFLRRRRYKMAARLTGELVFIAVLGFLALHHWQGVLWVLVIPVLFTRLMMMNGNWSQHAFVERSHPEDPYRNSLTCINSLYNRRCFNDGYHIAHHIHPTMHWTEVPRHFKENLESYRQADAVVFQKIDYFIIWLFLMLKRFEWLAHYFVDLGPRRRSKQEIVAFLKSRVQPQKI
jgi:Fatty acid desaturase